MLTGEVIKFFRQKVGLTQEDLGRGICSVTHVSKIERGQTPYSSEIISLFSERLLIDIEKEVKRLKELGIKLHNWHKLLSLQRMKEVEELKKELESMPIIPSTKYAVLYRLLLARYYLLHRDFDQAQLLLTQVQMDFLDLPSYEKNLYRHVQGIYYLINYRNTKSESYHRAINILKEIEWDEYDNFEYYYHLAAAYQWSDSPLLAYSYAEKALRYFKETDHFQGAILAESVMLLSLGRDTEHDFKEIEATYQRLIHNCEVLNATDKKIILLNNLGYEYFRRKEYDKAKESFFNALRIVPKPSILYLQRWYNYVKCCFEGKLARRTELIKKARNGLRMAKELNNAQYKIAFKLLVYRIEENHEQYYSFIEQEALPFFEAADMRIFLNRFGKELYFYYVNQKHYEKAVQVSNLLIDSIISD
jgi:HTH-type transcriptional regulator, quorum sensing regulator NprR